MVDEYEVDQLRCQVQDLEEQVEALEFANENATEDLSEIRSELALLRDEHEMLQGDRDNLVRAMTEVREITGESLEIDSK